MHSFPYYSKSLLIHSASIAIIWLFVFKWLQDDTLLSSDWSTETQPILSRLPFHTNLSEGRWCHATHVADMQLFQDRGKINRCDTVPKKRPYSQQQKRESIIIQLVEAE